MSVTVLFCHMSSTFALNKSMLLMGHYGVLKLFACFISGLQRDNTRFIRYLTNRNSKSALIMSEIQINIDLFSHSSNKSSKALSILLHKRT